MHQAISTYEPSRRLRFSLSVFVAFLLVISVFAAGAEAGECNPDYFKQLNNDDSETTLYRDTMAQRACLGRNIRGKGTVLNVPDDQSLEIAAEDGFEYAVDLSVTHNCGNLLRVKKGQEVSFGGTVTRVYRNILTLRIGDAYCVVPIN